MEDTDGQSGASATNAAEILEEPETSEVSPVPERRPATEELRPPRSRPLSCLASLASLPAIPEMLQLELPLALRKTPKDTGRQPSTDFPPVSRTGADRPEDFPQLPNRPI
jgi:hypothetical protein